MADEQTVQFETTAGPLGPGDDDPKSPARGALETTAGPPGPGDGDDDGMMTINPPADGPGDTATGPRHVTRVPRQPRTE